MIGIVRKRTFVGGLQRQNCLSARWKLSDEEVIGRPIKIPCSPFSVAAAESREHRRAAISA